jgi:DNA-binding NarL/FixJ family response regulator
VADDAGGRIRVLICDDHPVVRQGLRAFLEAHMAAPDFHSIGGTFAL